jgi:hypothetical protein
MSNKSMQWEIPCWLSQLIVKPTSAESRLSDTPSRLGQCWAELHVDCVKRSVNVVTYREITSNRNSVSRFFHDLTTYGTWFHTLNLFFKLGFKMYSQRDAKKRTVKSLPWTVEELIPLEPVGDWQEPKWPAWVEPIEAWLSSSVCSSCY